jgi:hypothetical protein
MSVTIEVSLTCDGRTAFGRCQDSVSLTSHSVVNKSDLAELRRSASAGGWKKTKHGKDTYWSDYCSVCSAALPKEGRS